MPGQDVDRLGASLQTWDLDELATGELDYSLVHPDVRILSRLSACARQSGSYLAGDDEAS
jgi:hypothetical protein